MDDATRELLQALRPIIARQLDPAERGYLLELVDQVLADDLDPQVAVERIRRRWSDA
jgi:hypothetical protein